MSPLAQVISVAWLPPGEPQIHPQPQVVQGERGRERIPLVCSLHQLEGQSCSGLGSPMGGALWPEPPGLMGTQPGSPLTPVLVPAWEKDQRSLPCSLPSPGEKAVTTGVMVAQALCGEEGDLRGGDRGQGEGGGGVGPQDPVEQLLLLLLELPP